MVARTVIVSTDPWTGELHIANAYEARAQLKASGARWDKRRRVWVLDPGCRDSLVPILEVCFGLRVVERTEYLPRRTDVPGWAELMLEAVPERLHEPVCRALIKELHPDHGGDGRCTQQLVDAMTRRRRSG